MRVFRNVLLLSFLAVLPACSVAGTVPLPTGSFTISNLRATVNMYGPPFTVWDCFYDGPYSRSTTLPQVQVSLQVHYPENPWYEYQQARFTLSGGSGTPFVGSAWIAPVVMTGDERWYDLSFDWSSQLSGSNPERIRLSSSYGWSTIPGAGILSGHVSLSFPWTIELPWFKVEVVPEPSCLAVVLLGCAFAVGRSVRRRRI